mmetsp:Transcript_84889/g.237013  ORF Transcript_84889/g.237013 Transcript_84889/m.237013 type:complete len:208 (-) Transcript_84889:38-661(-)
MPKDSPISLDMAFTKYPRKTTGFRSGPAMATGIRENTATRRPTKAAVQRFIFTPSAWCIIAVSPSNMIRPYAQQRPNISMKFMRPDAAAEAAESGLSPPWSCASTSSTARSRSLSGLRLLDAAALLSWSSCTLFGVAYGELLAPRVSISDVHSPTPVSGDCCRENGDVHGPTPASGDCCREKGGAGGGTGQGAGGGGSRRPRLVMGI